MDEIETLNLTTIIVMLALADLFSIPILSSRQIVCSPTVETIQENGLYKSIRLAMQGADLAEALTVLPPSQKPDAIIVWADVSCTSMPIGLAKKTAANC